MEKPSGSLNVYSSLLATGGLTHVWEPPSDDEQFTSACFPSGFHRFFCQRFWEKPSSCYLWFVTLRLYVTGQLICCLDPAGFGLNEGPWKHQQNTDQSPSCWGWLCNSGGIRWLEKNKKKQNKLFCFSFLWMQEKYFFISPLGFFRPRA